MEKLHTFLDRQVANFSILFTKLHNHHWYVTGFEFFRLHELFEEYYDEVNEYYDEFAERLLTIGGKPTSTLKGYLEIATLKEVNKQELTSKEMVQDVLNDFETIIDELKSGVKIAQDVDDEQSADLFISTTAALEKHSWMLRFALK
ncbi:MAG TPA: DNA starvation/stationary phase protection protein [Acholeplasmataceae bacterium]|nr:DNA starvation/stationary phase protection protein [Acholeplasmataceae bacterium]